MTKDRLNFLLSAITYRAKRQMFIDELSMECRKAGFDPETNMLNYIEGVVMESDFDDTPKKPASVTNIAEAKTEAKVEPTLRESLTEILNSGWDFSSLYDPEGAREMCSEEGDCLDRRLSELSDGQQRFIKAIKRHHRIWKDPRSNRRTFNG